MKTLNTIIAVALIFGLASIAVAERDGLNSNGAGTLIRGAGTVVSNTEALGTTFTIPGDTVAIHYLYEFTIGSLTNATISPAYLPTAASTGGDASTSYSKVATGYCVTLSADRMGSIRVPREQFAGNSCFGAFYVSTGTTTSSDLILRYKLERTRGGS